MPSHAFLKCNELTCPYCSQRLTAEHSSEQMFIKFQWGYLSSRYAEQPESQIYQIGDKIRWRPNKDGQIQAWIAFSDNTSMNSGDPLVEHLIVTETGGDVQYFPYECAHCKKKNGGGALEIVNNIIVRAWAFKPDELIDGYPPVYRTWRADLEKWVTLNPSEAQPYEIVDLYLVNLDGSITPKLEWQDMPLTRE